jgi:hypothetical protein
MQRKIAVGADLKKGVVEILPAEWPGELAGVPNPPIHGLPQGLVGWRVFARVLDRKQHCANNLDAFGVGAVYDPLLGGDELFRRRHAV